MESPKYSLIVPAYNEEKSISNVIESLKKLDIVSEIIVVNDCSTDSTKQKAHPSERMGFLKLILAVTYSPTRSPVQYHRP